MKQDCNAVLMNSVIHFNSRNDPEIIQVTLRHYPRYEENLGERHLFIIGCFSELVLVANSIHNWPYKKWHFVSPGSEIKARYPCLQREQ